MADATLCFTAGSSADGNHTIAGAQADHAETADQVGLPFRPQGTSGNTAMHAWDSYQFTPVHSHSSSPADFSPKRAAVGAELGVRPQHGADDMKNDHSLHGSGKAAAVTHDDNAAMPFWHNAEDIAPGMASQGNATNVATAALWSNSIEEL